MTTQQAISTQQVANRLVELCRKGDYETVYSELFDTNVISKEPENSQMPMKTAKGVDQIKERGKMFNEQVEEMHGGSVSEPLVAGNFITLTMGMDVTMKGQGRMNMDEVIVYEVKDGKIVSEQFFY